MEKQTNIRLSEKHRADLKALATGLGLSQKAVVQMALKAFLASHQDALKAGYETLKRGESVKKQ